MPLFLHLITNNKKKVRKLYEQQYNQNSNHNIFQFPDIRTGDFIHPRAADGGMQHHRLHNRHHGSPKPARRYQRQERAYGHRKKDSHVAACGSGGNH